MGRLLYSIGRAIGRGVGVQTMRIRMLHADRFDQAGGFVVACTHLSHLEPLIVSGLMRRPIDWMARTEFYRSRPLALFMKAMDAFPVKRQGVTAKSIRTAIERITAGRVVGIFPEGGVVAGANSVMVGGSIKLGACVIAMRAGKPIVPIALLGTQACTRVRPWIPFPGRQIRLWVIFGKPIDPPTGYSCRRTARFEMGRRLAQEYQSIYQELCDASGIRRGGGV